MKHLSTTTLLVALSLTGAIRLHAQDVRIDINAVYPEKTFTLQDVARVKYIPLETRDDMLFNGKITHLSDKGIAAYNKKEGDILLFDGEGKAIGSFNHKGQGPNEYAMTYQIDVDWTRKEIYHQDNLREKIRIYGLGGNHLRTLPIKGKMREADMYVFSDTQLAYFQDPDNPRNLSAYQPVHLMNVTDGKTKTLPFTKTDDTKVKATGGPFGNMTMLAAHVPSLRKLGDELYVSEVTSDLIYRVNESLQLVPVITRTPSYKEEKGKDFLLTLIGSNRRFLFFKRQQALLEFDDKGAARDTESTHLAYDKQRKELYTPHLCQQGLPVGNHPTSQTPSMCRQQEPLLRPVGCLPLEGSIGTRQALRSLEIPRREVGGRRQSGIDGSGI